MAFFWLGLLWSRSLLGRVSATLAVMAAGVALAVGLEFTQIFFPPRTVAMNDIIAESIGTVVGIAVWWARGPWLLRWYDDWRRAKTPATLAERVAWTYLAVVFMYGVLPLGLTVSAVEIFHKWREGNAANNRHLPPAVAAMATQTHSVEDLPLLAGLRSDHPPERYFLKPLIASVPTDSFNKRFRSWLVPRTI